MKTITEHLDDLDRMVDSGSAPKHEIRSQIAFIGKLVVAQEQEYVSAVESAAKLQEEYAKLKQAQLQRNDRAWDELKKESDEYHKMIRSHQLNHDV
jgi:hypothetical protein